VRRESATLDSSERSSYWRMALVLNEREAEEATGRRDLERRPEEKIRLTATEEAIERLEGSD